ncbi:hypothetical protein SAMN05216503_3368 [Polaribacter sp. KT25b]|nr:hypothetical protein SAMN05216503_3368 [Polaribacter sp. KT25b]
MFKKVFLLAVMMICSTFYSENKAERLLDSLNKYFSISVSIPFPEKKLNI